MTATHSPQYLTASQRRLRADIRNLTLWTFQGWLTMMLVAAGYAKVAEPMTSLEILLGWAGPEQESFVRALGWIEIAVGLTPLAPLVLGAAGRALLLPGLAAICIAAAVWIVLHGVRMEAAAAAFNLPILALALAVLKGRLRTPPTI